MWLMFLSKMFVLLKTSQIVELKEDFSLEKTVIKANELRAMIEVGSNRLAENAEFVNSLNVFPVPDGDTGTNMNLSFTSGVERIINSDSQTTEEVANDLAKGLLMGARGNSGVILSQLFRGFAKACEGQAELDGIHLAQAFHHGVETAYKAVMKPVEGTILTVARESAEAGVTEAETTSDVIAVMKAIVAAAEISLQNTPNLLPVLKEVGVVDSGGQGLLFIYAGFLEALTGDAVAVKSEHIQQADVSKLAHEENFFNTSHAIDTDEIEFGYCTEIMVKLGDGKTVTDEFDYDTFRNYLAGMGDSLLVVADDEIVKVHVHTETPGEVMNYGQKFGSLLKIKVDNMRVQHGDILNSKGAGTGELTLAPSVEKNEFGIIAIAAGAGVQQLFKSLGATTIINGGQTMNPSTEDIVMAINQSNAENVIILPNNKNIFMAAKQAAEVADIPAVVIETRTISQGLTALLGFNDMQSLAENLTAMSEEMANVKSGQITNAVRDTTIDGIVIKKDDFMGIVDGDIIGSHAELATQALATIEAMLDEESEIVTIIFGDQVSEAAAAALAEKIAAAHQEIEIDMIDGGQPVYHYILSVE